MYVQNKKPRSRSTTQMSGLVLIIAIASQMATAAYGFSSSASSLSSSVMTRTSTTTELSATTAKKNYPAMTLDEVQAMLDTVPVYAVTEPDQEGLVLLKEKNNPNDIAYFFFSAEAANTVFSPLRKKENSKSGDNPWGVSAYPLGLVWFDLINDPEQQSQGVEYRLLPEPDDLIGAQNLLREQQKQSKTPNPKINELFQKSYNDIPIFVDQFLRVTAAPGTEDDNDDNRERVPMYIGLKDLMDTCNQAIKASSGEYEAAMSAIDLKDLIGEMMKKGGNANDYRRAIIVPPSPAKAGDSKSSSNKSSTSPGAQKSSDPFQWEGKQGIYGKTMDDDEQISTPTASNDWSD